MLKISQQLYSFSHNVARSQSNKHRNDTNTSDKNYLLPAVARQGKTMLTARACKQLFLKSH